MAVANSSGDKYWGVPKINPVIVNFDSNDFDPDTEFFKIGKDSVGGKARGLAFASDLLRLHAENLKAFKGVNFNLITVILFSPIPDC